MGKLHSIRKMVVVEADGCVGHEIICEYAKPGGELVEKRVQVNHPNASGVSLANFSVPEGFTGDVDCEIHGSTGGSDKFTVTVPA